MKQNDKIKIKRLLNFPINLSGLSMEEIVEKVMEYLGVNPKSFIIEYTKTRPRNGRGVKVATPSTVFQLFPDDNFNGFHLSVKPSISVSVRGDYLKHISYQYRWISIKNDEISLLSLDEIVDAYITNNRILSEDIYSVLDPE